MMPQNRPTKTVLTAMIVFILSLASVWLCINHPFIFNNHRWHRSTGFICNPPMARPMNEARRSPADWNGPINTLLVYTGRWKFIRILFPYVYRELRTNGGVLDRVLFMMINYDYETYDNLVQLTRIANKLLKQDIFQLNFMGYSPHKPPPLKSKYSAPYYNVLFPALITNSSNTYFKMDDDIVYVHPGTFKKRVRTHISVSYILQT